MIIIISGKGNDDNHTIHVLKLLMYANKSIKRDYDNI